MKKTITALSVISAMTLLSACGSDDDNKVEEPKFITATFIDSEVAGLEFRCGDDSGLTDANGEFTFIENSSCNFKLGGFDIGTTSQLTEADSIVTPYDIAETSEKGVKIASLLQTVNVNGDPDNGIDVTGFDGGVLPDNLLSLDDDEFIEQLEESTGLVAVSLDDAKEHLDNNVGQSKGYHSAAVQTIVDDVRAILPEIEKANYQSKLAEYHAILEKGDDSNNADIETLTALIAIAEVVNEPIVAERLDIEQTEFKYTEMLPKVIDSVINSAQANFIEEQQGTTDDIAALFYSMAERLVEASDKLAASFADENYVAMYDKSGSANITYNDAHSIRAAALVLASKLSTLSAYQYGSDEYVIPQQHQAKIDLIKTSYQDFEFNIEYIQMDMDTEYSLINISSNDFLNDETVGRLRAEPQYLALAKKALTDAAEIGLMLDLASMGLAPEEVEELEVYLQDLNTHLSAADGSADPLVVIDGDLTYTVNLQAFYSLETGIDRNDFTINAYQDCATGDQWSEVLSKVADDAICGTDDVLNSDGSLNYGKLTWLTWGQDDNGQSYELYIKGYSAYNDADFEESPTSTIDDVLMSCMRSDEVIDCREL
ncbi:hypothetical protein [Shewanella sp. TC10]|uniref:hypothetical protein n=1 Tax=Shewanella sp. TC10 TaxID=1419739 RepID=UPI00129E1157|nr:hypothetical protein [Shewanella sp. TC10]